MLYIDLLVLISEECGNPPKVVVDGGEVLLEPLTKRWSQTFYKSTDVHFVTINISESNSSS